MAGRRPNLLLIAATDSSGGAGLQADLRVCAALDCHPLSAVTAVTAQSAARLYSLRAVEPDVVAAQLEAVASLPIAAVKIGLLPNTGVARLVAEWLRGRSEPVVVDPVLEASGGQSLVEADVLGVLRHELLPLAALATPNGPEFSALTGAGPDEGKATIVAARGLLRPGGALLLKGGHRAGAACEDLLITAAECRSFSHPRRSGPGVRGTGCTLATACAAGLARGLPLVRAVEDGIDYVQRALTRAKALGDGVAAL